mmetsp:Transcript_54478/g.132214  ORF Transcript_54478/g.132214 Transcript_54478/m.132214 type:complete len:209 (-) Transcript_54478:670-1296(-)
MARSVMFCCERTSLCSSICFCLGFRPRRLLLLFFPISSSPLDDEAVRLFQMPGSHEIDFTPQSMMLFRCLFSLSSPRFLRIVLLSSLCARRLNEYGCFVVLTPRPSPIERMSLRSPPSSSPISPLGVFLLFVAPPDLTMLVSFFHAFVFFIFLEPDTAAARRSSVIREESLFLLLFSSSSCPSSEGTCRLDTLIVLAKLSTVLFATDC